ncbi:MAG TPA: T9SS type A sorting domain-containing protein, partial [Flavobacteriales bacterium]|nr:T9SS type A sorting domain-containing protein [Flavobacteriales bacterium]
GSYHGYNDGTTNDVYQRMVSRLYGLDVGVEEEAVQAGASLSLAPNPATAWCTVEYDLRTAPEGASVELLDITGRSLWRAALNNAKGQTVLDTRNLASGNYMVRLLNGGAILGVRKLNVMN